MTNQDQSQKSPQKIHGKKRQRPTSHNTPTKPTKDAKRTKNATSDLSRKLESTDLNATGRNFATYHDCFTSAESDVASISTEFCEEWNAIVEKGVQVFKSKAVAEAYEKIAKYQRPSDHYDALKPVAATGRTGAGKSRFISALLQTPSVALESDSTRGTNLVHEYLKADDDQTSKFTVKACYFSEDDIRDHISRHCQSIMRLMRLKKGKDAGEDVAEQVNDADLKQSERAAVNFFSVLLCDQTGFANQRQVRDWFEARFEDSGDENTLKLFDMIKRLRNTRQLVDDAESHPADTINELHEVFKKVSRSPKASGTSTDILQPHPWPLIRKVQVFFQNDVLQRRVILADTPGIADTDQLIVERTWRYLKETTDTILIVAPISRADASEEIEEILGKCVEMKKTDRIYLILTMIDVKDKITDLASLSSHDRELVETAEDRAQRLQQKENELIHRRDRLLDEDESNELLSVVRELRTTQEQLSAARDHQLEVEVGIRNRQMKNQLKGKLREARGRRNAQDLKVFCTSATGYMEQKDHPRLSQEATGIPAVLRMLHDVPARQNFNVLDNIARDELPQQLRTLSSILNKTPFEKYTEVRTGIEKMYGQKRKGIMNKAAQKLQQAVNGCIGTVIENDEIVKRWLQGGQDLIDDWKMKHVAMFKAYCTKNGEHRPGKMKDAKKELWNKRLQEVFAGDLGTAFDKLEKRIEQILVSTKAELGRMFIDIQDFLSQSEDFRGASNRDEFGQEIVAAGRLCLRTCDKQFRVVTELTNETRRCAYLSSDKEDSLVYKEMSGAYNNAVVKGERAKSSREPAHQARVEEIRVKIAEGGPTNVFIGVCHEIIDKLRGGFSLESDKLKAEMKEHGRALVKNFSHRYQRHAKKDTKAQKPPPELVNAVDGALHRLEDTVWSKLDECGQWDRNQGDSEISQAES